MNDQGEKIVFLARELLASGIQEPAPARQPARIAMSFKALCLTTLLAATGGSFVTAWVHEDARPLNRYEKTELDALIFYTSKIKGIDQDQLRLDVEKKVGVAHFDDMTASDFSIARRYLQEQAQ